MDKSKRHMFKCPNCGIHIHTLTSYYVDGIIYYYLNIGEDGKSYTTSEESDSGAACQYSCNECGYYTLNMQDFITKAICNCEHEYVMVEKYDGKEICVCERCGIAW